MVLARKMWVSVAECAAESCVDISECRRFFLED